jgi:chitinase
METTALKRQWASSRCYGGTMIWSVDLYSGAGSGNTPNGLGSSQLSSPGVGGS